MPRLALKVPPLLLCAIVAALSAAAASLLPGTNLPFPGHKALSVLLLSGGLAVMLAGAMQFRLQQTTLDPRYPERTSRIVSGGIFRFTRNPMYLGMALLLAAVAAWPASIPGLVLAALFCVYINELQIKPEEHFLLRQFGDEYRHYMARVRRWL